MQKSFDLLSGSLDRCRFEDCLGRCVTDSEYARFDVVYSAFDRLFPTPSSLVEFYNIIHQYSTEFKFIGTDFFDRLYEQALLAFELRRNVLGVFDIYQTSRITDWR